MNGSNKAIIVGAGALMVVIITAIAYGNSKQSDNYPSVPEGRNATAYVEKDDVEKAANVGNVDEEENNGKMSREERNALEIQNAHKNADDDYEFAHEDKNEHVLPYNFRADPDLQGGKSKSKTKRKQKKHKRTKRKNKWNFKRKKTKREKLKHHL